MWNAKRDACDDCRTCEYFLHEFWNCQGDTKKCDEYIVARMSRQGEWMEEMYIDGHTHGTCSNCLHIRIQDNFCPNCGADMRGEK